MLLIVLCFATFLLAAQQYEHIIARQNNLLLGRKVLNHLRHDRVCLNNSQCMQYVEDLLEACIERAAMHVEEKEARVYEGVVLAISAALRHDIIELSKSVHVNGGGLKVLLNVLNQLKGMLTNNTSWDKKVKGLRYLKKSCSYNVDYPRITKKITDDSPSVLMNIQSSLVREDESYLINCLLIHGTDKNSFFISKLKKLLEFELKTVKFMKFSSLIKSAFNDGNLARIFDLFLHSKNTLDHFSHCDVLVKSLSNSCIGKNDFLSRVLNSFFISLDFCRSLGLLKRVNLVLETQHMEAFIIAHASKKNSMNHLREKLGWLRNCFNGSGPFSINIFDLSLKIVAFEQEFGEHQIISYLRKLFGENGRSFDEVLLRDQIKYSIAPIKKPNSKVVWVPKNTPETVQSEKTLENGSVIKTEILIGEAEIPKSITEKEDRGIDQSVAQKEIKISQNNSDEPIEIAQNASEKTVDIDQSVPAKETETAVDLTEEIKIDRVDSSVCSLDKSVATSATLNSISQQDPPVTTARKNKRKKVKKAVKPKKQVKTKPALVKHEEETAAKKDEESAGGAFLENKNQLQKSAEKPIEIPIKKSTEVKKPIEKTAEKRKGNEKTKQIKASKPVKVQSTKKTKTSIEIPVISSPKEKPVLLRHSLRISHVSLLDSYSKKINHKDFILRLDSNRLKAVLDAFENNEIPVASEVLDAMEKYSVTKHILETFQYLKRPVGREGNSMLLIERLALKLMSIKNDIEYFKVGNENFRKDKHLLSWDLFTIGENLLCMSRSSVETFDTNLFLTATNKLFGIKQILWSILQNGLCKEKKALLSSICSNPKGFYLPSSYDGDSRMPFYLMLFRKVCAIVQVFENLGDYEESRDWMLSEIQSQVEERMKNCKLFSEKLYYFQFQKKIGRKLENLNLEKRAPQEDVLDFISKFAPFIGEKVISSSLFRLDYSSEYSDKGHFLLYIAAMSHNYHKLLHSGQLCKLFLQSDSLNSLVFLAHLSTSFSMDQLKKCNFYVVKHVIRELYGSLLEEIWEFFEPSNDRLFKNKLFHTLKMQLWNVFALPSQEFHIYSKFALFAITSVLMKDPRNEAGIIAGVSLRFKLLTDLFFMYQGLNRLLGNSERMGDYKTSQSLLDAIIQYSHKPSESEQRFKDLLFMEDTLIEGSVNENKYFVSISPSNMKSDQIPDICVFSSLREFCSESIPVKRKSQFYLSFLGGKSKLINSHQISSICRLFFSEEGIMESDVWSIISIIPGAFMKQISGTVFGFAGVKVYRNLNGKKECLTFPFVIDRGPFFSLHSQTSRCFLDGLMDALGISENSSLAISTPTLPSDFASMSNMSKLYIPEIDMTVLSMSLGSMCRSYNMQFFNVPSWESWVARSLQSDTFLLFDRFFFDRTLKLDQRLLSFTRRALISKLKELNIAILYEQSDKLVELVMSIWELVRLVELIELAHVHALNRKWYKSSFYDAIAWFIFVYKRRCCTSKDSSWNGIVKFYTEILVIFTVNDDLLGLLQRYSQHALNSLFNGKEALYQNVQFIHDEAMKAVTELKSKNSSAFEVIKSMKIDLQIFPNIFNSSVLSNQSKLSIPKIISHSEKLILVRSLLSKSNALSKTGGFYADFQKSFNAILMENGATQSTIAVRLSAKKLIKSYHSTLSIITGNVLDDLMRHSLLEVIQGSSVELSFHSISTLKLIGHFFLESFWRRNNLDCNLWHSTVTAFDSMIQLMWIDLCLKELQLDDFAMNEVQSIEESESRAIKVDGEMFISFSILFRYQQKVKITRKVSFAILDFLASHNLVKKLKLSDFNIYTRSHFTIVISNVDHIEMLESGEVMEKVLSLVYMCGISEDSLLVK